MEPSVLWPRRPCLRSRIRLLCLLVLRVPCVRIAVLVLLPLLIGASLRLAAHQVEEIALCRLIGGHVRLRGGLGHRAAQALDLIGPAALLGAARAADELFVLIL